jgi:hypothetical protein
MFAAQVSCDGCHTHVIPTGEHGAFAMGEKSLEAERKACVVCHGAGYDEMLDEWINVMDHAVDEFRPKLDQARTALEQHRGEKSGLSETEILINDAQHNFDMVSAGKGAHNVEYAVKLLKAAADQIDVAMKCLDADAKLMDRDRLLGSPDGYCAILCHASVGVPEEVSFAEMRLDFPHEIHADDIGIECTTCHSPEKHKMRISSSDECMKCHHEQQDIECRNCHASQDTVYRGVAEGYGLAEDIPGTMSEAIECADCHDLEVAGPLLPAIREKCVECHEPGYDVTLIEWEQVSQNMLYELAVKLEEARVSLKQARRAGRDLQELEASFEQAKHIFETIEAGGAVHNLEYANAIMAVAKQKLQAVITQSQP